MGKVKTSIMLDEELWKKLQVKVIEKKGIKKGELGEALEEAIQLWLKKPEKKEKIRKRTSANSGIEPFQEFQEVEKTFRAR